MTTQIDPLARLAGIARRLADQLDEAAIVLAQAAIAYQTLTGQPVPAAPAPAPADDAPGVPYPDLPRCSCGNIMRPHNSKAADYPGTVTRASKTVCHTCYYREHNRALKAQAGLPVEIRKEPAPGLAAAPAPAPDSAEGVAAAWAEQDRQAEQARRIEQQHQAEAKKQAQEEQARAEAAARKREQLRADTERLKQQAAQDNETRLRNELDAYLTARRRRGAPATGRRMPGEHRDPEAAVTL